MSEMGIEETITSITKARTDVAIRQIRIDNSSINLDIRVNILDSSNTRLASTDANELDLLAAPFFKHIDGGDGSATGSEHWIQNQAHIIWVVWRELVVVLDGLEGDLVAEETKMEHRGMRQQVQKSYKRKRGLIWIISRGIDKFTINKADTRAKNGNQSDLLGKLVPGVASQDAGALHRTLNINTNNAKHTLGISDTWRSLVAS
jgi:hypothetical protein